jgi:ribonuclease HI
MSFDLSATEPVTVVYTDGACRGNPGPGGWAWAVDGGASASGGEAHTTNQRMEVTAVVRALQALPGPLLVVSDSTYVVNCFRQRWWVGWQRRGWRNSQNKPVANQDLWRVLLDLALDPSRTVNFEWVKGHSGNRMNDMVDLLATQAADRQ